MKNKEGKEMSKEEMDYAIKEAYRTAMFEVTMECVEESMNEWNAPTAEELVNELNKNE